MSKKSPRELEFSEYPNFHLCFGGEKPIVLKKKSARRFDFFESVIQLPRERRGEIIVQLDWVEIPVFLDSKITPQDLEEEYLKVRKKARKKIENPFDSEIDLLS